MRVLEEEDKKDDAEEEEEEEEEVEEEEDEEYQPETIQHDDNYKKTRVSHRAVLLPKISLPSFQTRKRYLEATHTSIFCLASKEQT